MFEYEYEPDDDEVLDEVLDDDDESDGAGAPSGAGAEQRSAKDDPPDLSNRLDAIFEALGEPDDDDDIETDTLDKLNVADLDPRARHVLRQVRLAQRKKDMQVLAEADAVRRAAATEKAEVDRARRELADAQEGFAKMFANKKLRERIKAGRAIDPNTLDVTDEDQLRQLAEHKMATALGEFVQPIDEAAEAAARLASRRKLSEQYPEFAEKGFEDEVRSHLTALQKAGKPIEGQLENAILYVGRARRLRAETERKERRRQQAATSQDHVGRRSGGAAGSSHKTPPRDVLRNPERLQAWVRDNPEDAAHFASRYR